MDKSVYANCPFCGSKYVEIVREKRFMKNDLYSVRCLCCGASSGMAGSESGAVRAWTMRA